MQLLKLEDYSIKYKDCEDLRPLQAPLFEIDQLIGLSGIKNALVPRILQYLQRKKITIATNVPNHICIGGPPGCGKTTLANCLARLFKAMGTIRTDNVVVGTRQNMIGSYVGHTEKHTQAKIDEAMGGVLLIDEAYSLGDGRAEGSDSFSKVCIDIINQNLSERGDEFLCIIVGYADALQRDFFSVNAGLARRFPWRYEIDKYSSAELVEIATAMTQRIGLDICEKETYQILNQHRERFTNHAASVQEFVNKLQMLVYRDSFGRAQVVPTTRLHMEEAVGMMGQEHASQERSKCSDMYV
jgi:SpoVK/Ycf46/Vps4 family AAA+-type ATPase